MWASFREGKQHPIQLSSERVKDFKQILHNIRVTNVKHVNDSRGEKQLNNEVILMIHGSLEVAKTQLHEQSVSWVKKSSKMSVSIYLYVVFTELLIYIHEKMLKVLDIR